MSAQAIACPGCGHPNATNSKSQSSYVGAPKSKTTAGILALLVGGLGIHKFYLNKAGLGILYILFSWTFVPLIISLIEGIVYLTQSDEAFSTAQKVNVI
jgi:TM2 domain-containing membrane protein YozV